MVCDISIQFIVFQRGAGFVSEVGNVQGILRKLYCPINYNLLHRTNTQWKYTKFRIDVVALIRVIILNYYIGPEKINYDVCKALIVQVCHLRFPTGPWTVSFILWTIYDMIYYPVIFLMNSGWKTIWELKLLFRFPFVSTPSAFTMYTTVNPYDTTPSKAKMVL